ncbi:DUF5990 family protein [Actinoplanes utahensis]|uniref:Monooxygenase n=1 Tax=Actinoplanes utahensis TaxID=1869 RepID=A0A0A6WZX2_ACTUT|nr:DUF5990 family protein [Actinoplanes utahensis]KHD73292.1 hypothetical protein MB27_35735 [Actinoplanes utahensis]GIF27417.1 hypothetical protein Aut01nite_04030 [Actinoplanes utahensis]
MWIRIEGHDLPGRSGAPQAETLRLAGVEVGVQRRAEVVDRVPVHADRAVWQLEIDTREVDGFLDVGGPWVHGRPGARFLYLSWGSTSTGTFAMFRRAKLLFADIPGELLRAAGAGEVSRADGAGEPLRGAGGGEVSGADGAGEPLRAAGGGELLRAAGPGGLVARLGLTGPDGGPRCARVRPPDITWALAE